MASAIPKTFHPLLLFLFLGVLFSIAYGGDERSYKTVSTTSFQARSICSTPKADPSSSRTFLILTHRHGPCAPTRSEKKPSFLQTLRQDELRAKYIQNQLSKGNTNTNTKQQQQQQQQQLEQSNVRVPTNLGSSIGTLEYVITVSYGTPAVSQTVAIDTGSDLPWIQCNPCPSSTCYYQNDPLFVPSKSSTYNPLACNAAPCRQLGIYANGCSNSQCSYTVNYGDGSYTTGVYSTDTLTLTSSSMIKNFQFGCGHDDEGLFKGIDGLMGLGRLSQSLISQASQLYGGVFSYCLPPTSSSSGFLYLGSPSSTSSFSLTPLYTEDNGPTFYIVLLTGISVGGQQLDIPSSAFSYGAIVDSGTIITRLTPTAYSALRSAFRSAMSAYPTAPPSGLFDTCYNFSNYNSVTVPTVVLMFDGGATMDLDVSGFLFNECLAFAALSDDADTAILGNVQQRTFEVLYDVSAGEVGFRPGAC